MTSPFADRTVEDWLDELPLHLESLEEEGVDLTVPQAATVEFAGPPEGREALRAHFEALGWEFEPGIGAEPNATMFLLKRDLWEPARLREGVIECFGRACEAACVFEGLYVTKLDQ